MYVYLIALITNDQPFQQPLPGPVLRRIAIA